MSDWAHDMTLTADEQQRLAATHAAMAAPSELGTAARVPMGEAFDVLVNELDDILNRMCGLDEVALARAWMFKYSMKVPDGVGEPPAAVAGTGAGASGGSPTLHLVQPS